MDGNPARSRNEAQLLGMSWYLTGIPCKNGHIEKRYANTGICYECKRLQMRRDYARYPQRTKVINEKSRKKNIIQAKATGRAWVEKNREKVRKIKQNYIDRNKEKCRMRARGYQAKKMLIPFARMSQRFSKSIWAFLKGGKMGRRWETLVWFSKQELYSHLESQFTGEMKWGNYGNYWHVDHIVPKAFFEKLNVEPEDKLRLAFSLINLRPCVKFGPNGNLSKQDKIIPELAAPVLKALGLSLDDVAARNIHKLALRYPNGFTADGGKR